MKRYLAVKLTCTVVLFLGVTIAPQAQTTFADFVNFNLSTGAHPYALIQGPNGNLYGTASAAGAHNAGTIYAVAPSGTVRVLHNFCASPNCADGAGGGVLLLGKDGNIYGAAPTGGNIQSCPYVNNGCGTIFKMTLSGAFTPLYSFCSLTNCADGWAATSLVQGSDGNLYGVTFGGGTHQNGTVLKITTAGQLTTLYNFCSQGGNFCADGSTPTGLIQAANGRFYGTTAGGGANNQGTVFEITSSGALTTLYSFCSLSNCSDGAGPEGGLIQASDGNFYGTTWVGGIASTGTFFKITPTGDFTTLYEFCSQIVGGVCADGAMPYTPIIQATDGNFYGTTMDGGANGNTYGTAFKITPSGNLTTLYSFCSQSNCSDGYHPLQVVQSVNGMIYGTTTWGGTHGYGISYALDAGLPPFVEALPASGSVGATVTIIGSDLTGTTAVSFNGTLAAFKVVTSTEIRAKIPTGATSGKIRVKTPSGVLLSNVAFRVNP